MVLVDGYNAIRRVPALRSAETKQGLGAGRDALIGRVIETGVLRSGPVVIVFDGEKSAGAGSSPVRPHRNLSLRFAPSADDAIVQSVTRSKIRESVTVVTADGDLAWRVKKLGAAVVAPETWLRSTPRKKRRPRTSASGSEKPRSSKADVSYWLEIFDKAD